MCFISDNHHRPPVLFFLIRVVVFWLLDLPCSVVFFYFLAALCFTLCCKGCLEVYYLEVSHVGAGLWASFGTRRGGALGLVRCQVGAGLWALSGALVIQVVSTSGW